MADIKDKVVTVDSLSALHEHNKETYMTKENPAGSGTISVGRKSGTDVGGKSVALGNDVTASGYSSCATGYLTVAQGYASTAEGYGANALGEYSHAEGQSTIADSKLAHVQGKFNVRDMDNRYAHIVGNGEGVVDGVLQRSNAHTLDWDGNAWFAGDVYVGGVSQDDATKLVKTTNIASIEYGDTLPEAGTVGRIFFKKISE